MGFVYSKETSQIRKPTKEEFPAFAKVPAYIDKIHFVGIKKTKDDVLKETTTNLFRAKNLEEVILKADEARRQLASLEAFKDINITLTSSHGENTTSCEGLEVFFNVQEKREVGGSFMFENMNNEPNIFFEVMAPNVFGRGEFASAKVSFGKSGKSFNIKNTLPFSQWSKPRFEQNLFSSDYKKVFKGYQEETNLIEYNCSFPSFPYCSHTLRCAGFWRHLTCQSSSTPILIREEAGHSVKGSLEHTFTLDLRENALFPSPGSYFQLLTEYAGLGGDTNFLKKEMKCQVNRCILGDTILRFNFNSGLMKPLAPDGSIRLNDRFFLGGPLSLRGFAKNGVGPQTQDCALGADAYWAAGFHAYTPLPFALLLPEWLLFRIHIHSFLNTGNIGHFTFTADSRHNTMVLLSGSRVSYGMGLAICLLGLQVELNYTIPFLWQQGDVLKGGMQFGIGFNFL